MGRLFFISFLFITSQKIHGQEGLLNKRIAVTASEKPLSEVLKAIEKEANVYFSYSSSTLNLNQKVSINAQDETINSALQQLLGQQLKSLLVEGNQITIQTNAIASGVSGAVIDQEGKPVPLATLSLEGHGRTRSDDQGHFSFDDIAAGSYTLKVSAVGYKSLRQPLTVQSDQQWAGTVILQPDGQLSEVVVTASRTRESIDEVPSSVSILNTKQIEQQIQINPSISDILAFTVPGLGPSSNKAVNTGQTLRGRSVLVLIDGIPQSTPLMNGARDIRSIDPAVIERVEIIKGATSIYGNGSGGGIINYITKKPTGQAKIGGQTYAGINGQPAHAANTIGYRFSQSLYGNLDKFSYVMSGTYNYSGVFKDAKGNVLAQDDGLSQANSTNIYAKAIYQFDTSTDLTVAYNFFRSLQHSDYINVPGVFGSSPAIGQKGESPGAPAGTPQNHNLYLTLRKSDLLLNSSLELTGYFNRFLSTNRYVERANGWYGPGQTQISSKKKGLRLNIHSPWGDQQFKGNFTYGVDVLGDITNQPLLDGRIYIPDMNMTNFAPFLQVKADLFDHFIFKGGLRYENARVKVADYHTLPKGPDGEGSIAVAGGNIHYRSTMFNAGLRYTKYDVFNPFVSFSQAFGLNELGRILRSASENTISLLQTDPIITNNYEAGFSSRFSIFHLTGSYFISTSELGANLVANEYGTLIPQRAPERIHGYEVTADARLNDKLSVGGTYAYVEGKAEQEDGSKTYLGYSRISPAKATGYIHYNPTQALELHLFWIYTGNRDRFDVQENGSYLSGQGPVKSVHLFNFSSAYQVSRAIKLGLGVENLFNKAYYPFYSQYSATDDQYVMGNGAKASLNIIYTF
ncbi:TonB-dependent receptor [Olivibacter sp. XZL3]|uniref:TonB-dependent receptor n=1 Tax=Olivibacter sp. XZL3 TaxID=1735116 RepID=UPI001F0DDB92|nr:TonB-dependent receptor [Olivibacter sp. XZL3]